MKTINTILMLLAFLLSQARAQAPKNPCDPYWYSIDNTAIIECRDNIRTMGRSLTESTLMILTGKSKLSPSDSPVERILNMDQLFVECVLEADDKVLKMDEIFLQRNERVYSNNGLLGELINACTQSVENVCPFNDVFNEDDKRASNCIPHPLQMLKCVRQSGISACNVRRRKEELNMEKKTSELQKRGKPRKY